MLGLDQTVKFEIELRGATIKASVTIEGILMKIVFFSDAKQYHTAEEPEMKTTSIAKVKAFVDSMGQQMDYHVAAMNSNV